MDLFSKLENVRSSKSHSGYAMRETSDEVSGEQDSFDYEKLSIFQDPKETQPIESQGLSDANMSVLGLDSKVLEGVMKRWGKKSRSEASESTEVGQTQPVETQTEMQTDASYSTILPTQAVKTQAIADTQPVSSSLDATQAVPATLPVSESTQIIGKTQKVPAYTQVLEETQVVQDADADADDDEDVVASHRHMNVIREEDDETSEVTETQEMPSAQVDANADVEADADASTANASTTIEGYRNMTREQKIAARLQLKKKERAAVEIEEEKAKEQQKEQEREKEATRKLVESMSKHKKINSKERPKTAIEHLTDVVKQNELIKKSQFVVRKSNKEKFAPSKLVAAFADSDDSDYDRDDDKLFSNGAVDEHEKTPHSSPKEVVLEKKRTPQQIGRFNLAPLGNYTEKLRQQAGKKGMMISLDDDDDGEEQEESLNERDKARVFEVKRRMSKKRNFQQPKKRTIKDLLRDETKKQMKKTVRETLDIPEAQVADKNEILQMMQDERDRDEKIRKREQQKEERNKLLLEGKLPDEDMDESEYSNEDDDDDDQSDRNDDIPSAQPVPEDDEEEDEAVVEEKEATPLLVDENADDEVEDDDDIIVEQTQQDSPEMDIHLSGGLGNMQFSLGDAFAQTLPSNKSMEGLEGSAVVRKLQDIENGEQSPETSFADTTTVSEVTNISFSKMKSIDRSLSTKEMESQALSQKKLILDSQNFLPDTQVDLSAEKTQQVPPTELGSEDSTDEEVYEDDETTRQLRMFKIREARKRENQRRRALQKEMKEKGISDMMENEAVESEDEWQGIGGAEGEADDEINSEDEKMLDDSSKIVVDKDKIRANLIEHDIKADDELVKKIYTDLKTGAFRKRRAHDGAYELDLSDDEEEYMREFYEHRRQEYLEQQLMKDANLRKLAKNESSRAFYNTIATDSMKTESFDFEVDGNEVEEEQREQQRVKDKDPFRDDHDEDEDEDIVRPKRRKLSVQQVRSMISFLDEDEDEPKEEIGIEGLDDDDGVDEIRYLKQHSKVRMRTLVAPRTESDKENASEDTADTQAVDEGGIGLLARTPSVTASFRHKSKNAVRYSTTTGNIMRDVTVTVGSKPTSHSNGSITSMSASHENLNRLQYKSSKVARIEETVKAARKHSGLRRIYEKSGGFA